MLQSFFVGSDGETIQRTGANCIVGITGKIRDTNVIVKSDDYLAWGDNSLTPEGGDTITKVSIMTSFTQLTGTNAKTYINTAKNYSSSVVHLDTADGTVVGITFVQQSTGYEITE